MKILRYIFYIFCLFVSTNLFCQKEYLLQADQAFNTGRYEKAITLYNQYQGINLDYQALTNRGISYFNNNLLHKAIADFTSTKKLGNTSPILYFYMAQCYQHLNDFDKASFLYKSFLSLEKDASPNTQRAEIELKNCVFSAFQAKDNAGSLVQNFGNIVNSTYDEINAVQGLKFGNVFYLSSNKDQTHFDILAYELNSKGEWYPFELETTFINNGFQNFALDIDHNNGNALLFLEKGVKKQKVSFATFDANGNDIEVELPSSIFKNTSDITIVNHNILVFASNELDGYGGYDLFTIVFENGSWQLPVNMGPQYNSKFDERCPFFSHNLKHFYFSSNRPYSFGGYDIYYCDLENKVPAANLGSSINSVGDDLFFKLDDAGHMATFSSNRKTGLGGFDLYFAYLQDVKAMGIRDSLVFEYLLNPPKESTTIFLSPENKTSLTEDGSLSIIDVVNIDHSKDTELVVVPVADSIQIAVSNHSEISGDDIPSKVLQPEIEIEETIIKSVQLDLDQESKTQKIPEAIQHDRDNKTAAHREEDIKIEMLPDPILVEEFDREMPVAKDKPIDLNFPNTLFYEDRHDLVNGTNKIKLDRLIAFINEKDLEIFLISHTDHYELGLPEYVQYNTLKRALDIADYLAMNGIDPDKIHIESVANNYPLAKSDIEGTPIDTLVAINKRIDIQLYSNDGLFLEDYIYKYNQVPAHALSKKYELYRSIREDIYYSVEVVATERIFKNAILRLYNDIYIRRDGLDSRNKYYIGLYTQKEDADNLKKQLEQSSAPYAKVVKFKNGRLF